MLINSRWICAAAGVVIAAGLWIGARDDQRLSWIVLLGFPFIGFYMAAFVVHWMPGPERVAYFLAGGGLLLVLDGAVTLVRYMRRNPATSERQI